MGGNANLTVWRLEFLAKVMKGSVLITVGEVDVYAVIVKEDHEDLVITKLCSNMQR